MGSRETNRSSNVPRAGFEHVPANNQFLVAVGAITSAFTTATTLLGALHFEGALQSATNIDAGARQELAATLDRIIAQAEAVGICPFQNHGPQEGVARDLVTVKEFAAEQYVAESTVFEWIKHGLPSIKTKGLGRRIRREEAIAWLLAGGSERGSVGGKRAKLGPQTRRGPSK